MKKEKLMSILTKEYLTKTTFKEMINSLRIINKIKLGLQISKSINRILLELISIKMIIYLMELLLVIFLPKKYK
jgi:hypothetical protein